MKGNRKLTKLQNELKSQFAASHSGCPTFGQIIPVIRFAWKTVTEMAENRDIVKGPPNITSSGSLEIVGLSTLF